jgi:hypothetical protein
VTEMTSDEVKAAFIEARAESLEILERTADIEVGHRSHDDDGHLTAWSKTMPPRPKPVPPPTIAEVEALIDGKISAALATYHEGKSMRPLTREVVAAALHEIRKQVRAEFAAEIDKLRSEHDLRISALLAEIEKLQRGLGYRAAEVIDLPPVLSLRGQRHA